MRVSKALLGMAFLLLQTEDSKCFSPQSPRPSKFVFDNGSPAYSQSDKGVDVDSNGNIGSSEGVVVVDSESQQLLQSLQRRVQDLEKNIGKRYKTRTQQGFLNVHQEPGDPFATDNIVGQLSEGDIVTSTGPNQGPWIQHDRGGWSISVYQGFVWLEALQE